MENVKNKRNGEIDILKFIFALGIFIMHFSISYYKGLLTKGYIGVEFFYVVTGYLMSCNASKKILSEDLLIPDTTWKFIISKIKSFYPYFLVAIFIRFIAVDIIFKYKGFLPTSYELIKSIPTFTLSFFLLNWDDVSMYCTGAWYLSAMIVAMFVLYPLLLKNFNLMTKIIFPILSLSLLGFIWKYYDQRLNIHSEYFFFCYSGLVRAIAEISLGASLYALVDFLNNYNLSKSKIILLTVIKYICFVILALYVFFGSKQKLDLHILLIACIGISLSFSNKSISIKGNNFTNFLGKFSLCIYIFHGCIRSFSKNIIKKDLITSLPRFGILILGVLICCFILMKFTDFLIYFINKIKTKKTCSK